MRGGALAKEAELPSARPAEQRSAFTYATCDGIQHKLRNALRGLRVCLLHRHRPWFAYRIRG